MSETRRRLSREEIAAIEVGHTDVSARLAWVLVLFFLAVIVAVPVIDQWADARGGEAGPRVPVAAEVTSILPGPAEISAALRDKGVFQGTLALNASMLRGIHDYETALEDRSAVANALIPPVQRLLAGTLRSGTESVYMGREGWLFYRPTIDMLTGKGFLDPAVMAARARQGSETVAPPQPDPIKAIVEFRDALASRGIELVLVPAPAKATVYPERFSSRYDGTAPVHNPSYRVFLDRLDEAGVHVFDPAPALVAAKQEEGEPLFLATDTHWSPAGMGVAAGGLARYLAENSLLPDKPGREFSLDPKTVTAKGDIAAMLRMSGDTAYTRPETVTLRQVRGPSGEPWQPDPNAAILLLGDSYANIYTLDAMGWGAGAGLPARLAAELGQPVDTIVRNDAGAYATRAELVRDLAQGRDRLRGKRLVIWEFAARELAQGDWRTGLVTEETVGKADTLSESDSGRQDNLKTIDKLAESQGGWTSWYHRLEPLHAAINEKLAVSREMIPGEDGWLFQGLLTEFQTIPVVEQDYAVWSEDYKQRLPDAWTPGFTHSVACIADTVRQLEAAGVHVLFVPIPQKAELYPEMLAPGLDPEVPASPQRYKVMRSLVEKGVRVADLLPALMREKGSAALPLYPKHDIHWRDAAVRTAARQIAEAVRPLLGEVDAGAFPAVSGTQEIATTCNDPLARLAGIVLSDEEQEPDILHAVTDADGNLYDHTAHPNAPVLVIGDSFMMGGNQGASLAAHLARELGVPVQGHYQQNGAQNVPAIFAREGKAFWSNHKVIVWYCVSGMLGRYWKPVAFSDTDPDLAQETTPVKVGSKGERLLARVSLKATTPVPTPADIAPYTENLTIFEYQVDEVLYGDCDLPNLYVAHWGVQDGKAVGATRNARIGDTYELQLELLSAHSELEGVNIADAIVTDYARPILFEVGGLAGDSREPDADTTPLRLSASVSRGKNIGKTLRPDAFSQAALVDRRNKIQEDLAGIHALAQSNGGWEAWMQAQAGYRTLLEPLRHEKGRPEHFWGNDGFLFVSPIELPYCFADDMGMNEPPIALRNQGGVSPFNVIKAFDRSLKELGMHLIVVPIPPRSEVEFGNLLPQEGTLPADWTHPARLRLFEALLEQDVEVVDVLPVLRALKEGGHQASLRMESHFTPEAAQAVAHALAQRIARYDIPEDPGFASSLGTRSIQLKHTGVYAKQFAAELGTLPPESLNARVVESPYGSATPPDLAPVLLIGDSYTVIYEKQKADLGSQLEAETKLPIRREGSAGGGPRGPRIFRQIDPDTLKNTKVVIWVFVARYLAGHDSIMKDWVAATPP